MTQTANMQNTADRLHLALTARQLPDDLLTIGERLLTHLKKPTQVSVLGPAQSGKSSLINMMIGAPCLPALQNVPIVQFAYASVAKTTYEGSTGQIHSHEGLATQDKIPQGTVRILQQMPVQSLADKTVVEINLPKNQSHQSVVLEWVTENTDVVIWCSQVFDDREAALWRSIPDKLKDHSFLALCKADQLQMKGVLEQQTARFECDLADEFLGLYPVATLQAAASRSDTDITDQRLWKASGGHALIDALHRQIASGKTADLDFADMILARAASADTAQTPCDARPAMPSPPHAAPTPPAVQTTAQDTAQIALDALHTCAQQLGTMAAEGDEVSPAEVLFKAGKTVQSLVALLAESPTDNPRVQSLRNDVFESEQIIQLLQLEATQAAACDAVTVLIQLKKECAGVVFA